MAYDYLAAEQRRFGKSDEEVAGSLVHVGFLPNRETYVLLAGALLSPRTCPHCGRPPDDFVDEETVVEDHSREAVLKLVK